MGKARQIIYIAQLVPGFSPILQRCVLTARPFAWRIIINFQPFGIGITLQLPRASSAILLIQLYICGPRSSREGSDAFFLIFSARMLSSIVRSSRVSRLSFMLHLPCLCYCSICAIFSYPPFSSVGSASSAWLHAFALASVHGAQVLQAQLIGVVLIGNSGAWAKRTSQHIAVA